MGTESLDEVLAENALSKIDSGALLLLFLLTVVVSWLLAWYFRDQYGTRSLIRAYLVYGIIQLFLGLIIWGLPFVLVIGIYLLGALLTAFRSNTYFYE